MENIVWYILKFVGALTTLVMFLLPLALLAGGLWLLGRKLLTISVRFLEKWEKTLDAASYVVEQAETKQALNEQQQQQAEIAELQQQLATQQKSQELYQYEIEQLIENVKKLEYQKNSALTQVTQPAVAPQPAAVAEEPKPLPEAVIKQRMRRVLAHVNQLDTPAVYQNALTFLDECLVQEQIRCALPYQVILRLLELYDQSQLMHFAESFSVFFEKLMADRDLRKVYGSRFFSPEVKLRHFADQGILEELDPEFVQFLFYMLQKFNLRKTKKLYTQFFKTLNVKYYSGQVRVELASLADQDTFHDLWEKQYPQYQVVYEENPQVKAGVRIHFDQLEIDMSYDKLIDYYIEHYETEVKF